LIKKRKKTEKNEGKQKKKTKKNKKKQRKKQRNYEAMICLSLCSNYLKLYIIIFASPPFQIQDFLKPHDYLIFFLFEGSLKVSSPFLKDCYNWKYFCINSFLAEENEHDFEANKSDYLLVFSSLVVVSLKPQISS